MQDRIKYRDGELEDDIKVREIRIELKNSETRIKAVKTINQAYEKIIDNMTKVIECLILRMLIENVKIVSKRIRYIFHPFWMLCKRTFKNSKILLIPPFVWDDRLLLTWRNFKKITRYIFDDVEF